MRKALGEISRLFETHGEDLFVTSMREGVHSAGSLHYDGGAVDFRRGSLTLNELRNVLSNSFDIVEHDNFFHVEYDP